ncbi:MAG: CZB domain-containing protein [Thiobacillus sp.]|nr:CZB domain-containing protein [Thiobacillus sp.]
MKIKSDIEDAIQVHGAWKTRFRDFLSGKVGLDLPDIGHTNACKLGMWLDDGGRRMLSPEDHAKTCELHAQFHQVAGDIVHHIKQKDFMAARQALAPAGAFDQASHAMCAFLHKLVLHDGPKSGTKADAVEMATEAVVAPAEPPEKQD